MTITRLPDDYPTITRRVGCLPITRLPDGSLKGVGYRRRVMPRPQSQPERCAKGGALGKGCQSGPKPSTLAIPEWRGDPQNPSDLGVDGYGIRHIPNSYGHLRGELRNLACDTPMAPMCAQTLCRSVVPLTSARPAESPRPERSPHWRRSSTPVGVSALSVARRCLVARPRELTSHLPHHPRKARLGRFRG